MSGGAGGATGAMEGIGTTSADATLAVGFFLLDSVLSQPGTTISRAEINIAIGIRDGPTRRLAI